MSDNGWELFTCHDWPRPFETTNKLRLRDVGSADQPVGEFPAQIAGIEARFNANDSAQGRLTEARLWIWRNGSPAPVRSAIGADAGGKL